jgi:hypothetical protein
MARRTGVVSCDLPVATLLQDMIGYGSQAGILLVIPQVIGIIIFSDTTCVLIMV